MKPQGPYPDSSAGDDAPAEELIDLDGRSAVRLTRHLRYPVERVWSAVTTSVGLSAWFPARVDLDPREGGRIVFDQEGSPTHGTVLVNESPRRFHFTWDSDEFRIELSEHPTSAGQPGTQLEFVHLFDDRPGAASFATGWGHCLESLRPVLATEELSATDGATPSDVEPGDRVALSMAQRHEELARRFGLDRGTVSRTGRGWTVRFERQLTCPARIAWNLFLGRDLESGEQRTAPGIGETLTPYAAPEVVLGTVTEVAAPELLAFNTAIDEPGDHVRLEFIAGTGQGARMVLTVTGTDPTECSAAEEQWGAGAVEHVAAEAAVWASRQLAGEH